MTYSVVFCLQKVYLAFVCHCKFTSAVSLPGIKFMSNSLVELLTVDPATTYQHGFVYIRQLAIHLRTAMTSGKKDSQKVNPTLIYFVTIYIFCHRIFCHMCRHV